jgi:hypothetical protein
VRDSLIFRRHVCFDRGCRSLRKSLACIAAAAATEESRQIASLGPDLWNRTYYPTKEDANTLKKPWYLVDAEGQTLGRLAVLVADHIR